MLSTSGRINSSPSVDMLWMHSPDTTIYRHFEYCTAHVDNLLKTMRKSSAGSVNSGYLADCSILEQFRSFELRYCNFKHFLRDTCMFTAPWNVRCSHCALLRITGAQAGSGTTMGVRGSCRERVVKKTAVTIRCCFRDHRQQASAMIFRRSCDVPAHVSGPRVCL